MVLRFARGLAAMAALVSSVFSFSVHANPTQDAPGGADHPLIKRFPGSTLIGYQKMEWDQAKVPTSLKVDGDRHLLNPAVVEGKITRLYYLGTVGQSRLEVFRNYQQALAGAGLQTKMSCDPGRECTDIHWHYRDMSRGFVWAKGSIDTLSGSRYGLDHPLSSEEGRFLYGTLNRGGKETHVTVYTSLAENHTTNTPVTFIEIIEPKAMTTGQVTIDAKALESGLQSEGKIALYGIFFDTGKSEVKPESKPQLDEMAKLLQAQPALKVYIVGHTDNQGTIDANIGLSQQRAQAVVAGLTAPPYKIDGKRLSARGVASLAPVASNTADEGRARNRRVELVPQ
jgi:OOP family OmpA-OmpF porin